MEAQAERRRDRVRGAAQSDDAEPIRPAAGAGPVDAGLADARSVEAGSVAVALPPDGSQSESRLLPHVPVCGSGHRRVGLALLTDVRRMTLGVAAVALAAAAVPRPPAALSAGLAGLGAVVASVVLVAVALRGQRSTWLRVGLDALLAAAALAVALHAWDGAVSWPALGAFSASAVLAASNGYSVTARASETWLVGSAAALAGAAALGRPLLALPAALLVVATAVRRTAPTTDPATLRWRLAAAVAGTTLPVLAAVPPEVAALGHGATGRATAEVGALVAMVTVRLAVAVGDDLWTRNTLDAVVNARTMALVQQEQWFRALVQNSSDVVTVVDVSGLVRYQSPSVASVFGHDAGNIVGHSVTRLLRPGDADDVLGVLRRVAGQRRGIARVDCSMLHANGEWRNTETIVANLVDDPDIHGLVLNTRDVTERKRLEAELTRAAFTDSLTGLANRALFRERVERAFDEHGRTARDPVVVVFCDLDGFKAVNDAQGHAVGDQLLGLVAERLRHCVRPGDTVARLGGDEFAVLLTGPGAEQAAVDVTDRLSAVLTQPFLLDGREIYVGTSAGIASSTAGAGSAEVLLRNADLAMYRAKGAPDTAYVRFEPAMHDALLARVALEADLRQALARRQFVVHYQPTVDLRTSRLVGAEALLRWYHPDRGVVPTEEFVALAEESGLITSIGEWVLGECLDQAARWQSYAAPGEVFHIAVNISGRQLQPALIDTVRAALAASGLPAEALVLEMTESVLIERTDDVVTLLAQLKELGVRLAIDDFGTGYSSLSYLSRFPLDVLKIDRAFVEPVGSGRSDSTELARTIVSLGTTLGLATVAEGIERGEQLAELRMMGCGLGQGFLFARPMPAVAITELLTLRGDDAAQPPAQPPAQHRRLRAV